jgi:DNA-binding MarR family transcriptional regulator
MTNRGKKGAVTRQQFALPPTTTHDALLKSGNDKELRELFYLLGQTSDRLQRCRAAFGKLIGITPAQYSILIGTSYLQGSSGVTIRRLAEFVMFARPQVTTDVSALIKKQLLLKRPNQSDGRSVLVSLSVRGESMLLSLHPHLVRVNDSLFEGITQSEFKTILGFFRKFSANGEHTMIELAKIELAKLEADRSSKST